MKIQDGYLLKKVAGNHVVVPVGDLDFEGLIKLNETGAFLWEILEKGSCENDLVKALTNEYDLSEIRQKPTSEFFLIF